MLLFAEMTGSEIALIITASGGVVIGLVSAVGSVFAAIWSARAKYLGEMNAAALRTNTAMTQAVAVQQVATKREVAAIKTDASAVKEAVADAAKATANSVQASTEAVAALNSKLDVAAQVQSATHTLVNGSMAAQLRISMLALKRVAELTELPEDIAAAALAQKICTEHDLKQAKVDASKHNLKSDPHP